MNISIDKSLNIALHGQIVGAVEYGIMAGELRPDALLPSVRALSRRLGVAQLTVSHAYSTLKTMGLIKTLPGKGTYVSRDRQPPLPGNETDKLRQRFMGLLAEAGHHGLSDAFFIGLINRHRNNCLHISVPIAAVGHSNRMNKRYLMTIEQQLGIGLAADSYTFDEFQLLDARTLSRYGLYLTIPHAIPLLRQRLGKTVPVYAPWLIPADETRQQLQSLPPAMDALIVSRFENFIPSMLQGIRRFAPQSGKLRVITLHDRHLAWLIPQYAAVIYSTGCHQHLQQFPPPEYQIEYRHTPDPEYLRAELYPVLHQLAE